MKAIIIDENYPLYKGIIFDVVGTKSYINSQGEKKTWYYLFAEEQGKIDNMSFKLKIPRVYMGKHQIKIIKS